MYSSYGVSSEVLLTCFSNVMDVYCLGCVGRVLIGGSLFFMYLMCS
jgi:hypothetical protein